MFNRVSSTRRSFLKTAATVTMAARASPALIIPGRARASRKTLKILQWHHFVPAFDEWFNQVYVKQWGEENNTEVIVDNVGMTSLRTDPMDLYSDCCRRFSSDSA